MIARRLAIVALVVATGLGLSGCVGFGLPFPGMPAGADGGQHGAQHGNGTSKGQGKHSDQGRDDDSPTGGVAGMVTSVSGDSAQVRNAARETKVTWTGSTRFTTEAVASPADLGAGDCVVVRRSETADGSGSDVRTVAAATITMFAPLNGSCAGGLGETGVAKANGNGMPHGMGGAIVGAVTSASDGSMVVSQTRGGATRDVTVTYANTTQFYSLKSGSASDVVAGACLVAKGKRASGAVAASAIVVSPGMTGRCGGSFVKPGPIHPTPDRTAGQ